MLRKLIEQGGGVEHKNVLSRTWYANERDDLINMQMTPWRHLVTFWACSSYFSPYESCGSMCASKSSVWPFKALVLPPAVPQELSLPVGR